MVVFAHIAGLTPKGKKSFISEINTKFNSNFLIKDLEDFTNLIINENLFLDLYDKYDKYLEKSKDIEKSKLENKKYLVKAHDISKKINELWKVRITFYINEFNCENNTRNIIYLGYCSFFRNLRVFINIETRIKIFIDIENKEEYTREIISKNIDFFKKDIINGNYDLNQLNPKILLSKRDILTRTYSRNNYEIKNFSSCLNFLVINSQNNIEIPNVLYYASEEKQEKIIKPNISNNKIVAYSEDWICLISCSNNGKISKGYENDDINKPFLEEIIPGAFNELNKPMYMYCITKTDSFNPIITKNYIYKYKTSINTKFFKEEYIENVLEKLRERKIKFYYFNK